MQTPPEIRFWRHVQPAEADECWLWTGATAKGYGMFSAVYFKNDKGQWRCDTERAHRYAYEMLIGPIPEGLTLDHLCGVPNCVNPWHLDPCPAEVNTSRANPRMDMCKKGLHSMEDEANVIRRPSKPNERECRACVRDRERRTRRNAA